MKQLKTFVYRAGLEALYRSGAYRLDALRDPGLGAILTLHHVRPDRGGAYAPNRELEITPEFLEVAIEGLATAGYDFVSLADVPARLDAGRDGRRFAAFTLDDGYRDNLEVALPVFRKFGVPMTVFVTSGFVDRTAILWWKVVEEVIGTRPEVVFDFPHQSVRMVTGTAGEKGRAAHLVLNWARTADPRVVTERVVDFARRYGFDPMRPTDAEVMTPAELKRLAADPLVTIGAHTRTHANLRRLDRDAVLDEMRGGADEIAAVTGERPTVFSYPYGSETAACRREFDLAAEAGFALSVTTRPGTIQPEHAADRHALPRVSLNGYFQSQNHLQVLMSGAPFGLYNKIRRLVA